MTAIQDKQVNMMHNIMTIDLNLGEKRESENEE